MPARSVAPADSSASTAQSVRVGHVRSSAVRLPRFQRLGHPQPQQRVHERARPVPGRRVGDEAGRLVHDEDVVVTVDDDERDVLRLRLVGRYLRHVQAKLPASPDGVSRAEALPVHGQQPVSDEALHMGP